MGKLKKICHHLAPLLFLIIILSLFPLFFSIHCKTLYAQMIITNIKIRKNFPVFERELHRVINLRIGEEYKEEQVKDVAKKIEGIYQNEGYENVKVETRIKRKGEEPEITLIFVIRKGKKARIKQINIIDDRPGEKPDPQHILRIRPGQVFKRKKLEERIKKLREYLIGIGYLKADVRYIKKFEDYGIKLDIYIHRESRIDIKIEGNKYLSKQRIMNAMTFFENRFFDYLEIEESIKRIKDMYIDEGFLDVQVYVEMDENEYKKEDKFIRFKIIEGKRTCLKGVRFENNEHIKDKRLKRQLLSMRSLSLFRPRAYKALTFAEDLEAISALYKSEGFPHIKISEVTERVSERCIKKRIIIDEGIRYKVRKVSITGNKVFPDKTLKDNLTLKVDSPLYPKKLEDDKRELSIFYGNNGYPYAKISQTREMAERRGQIDLSYNMDEGQYVRFGKLIIRRNLKTKDKVINLACTFGKGDPFSYRKILETQERLSNLGLFRSLSVEPKGLENKQNEVDCEVEVEEMKTGQINFGAGFSSRVGYRGYMELREDNLWGRAIMGGFRADLSGFGKEYNLVEEIGRSEKYTISFRDPLFIPRHKVEGEGKLYYMTEDRKEYHTRSNSLNLSLWRPYKRKNLRVGITYHISLNRLKDITIDLNDIPEKYEEHTISAVGPTIIYDSRDNFVDPKKGIYTNLNLDWAGGLIGGNQDFYKLQGEGRLFLPISSNLVLAISIRGGYIELYGRTGKVPIQERFFAGGGNTIRGYREDSLGPVDSDTGLPLGGRMFWINNIELRFPIYKNLKGIIFFDTGNVWENKSTIHTNDLRDSAGVGLRWITPIGPIRLDYGMPIDRKSGEPKSRAYLSIGHAF